MSLKLKRISAMTGNSNMPFNHPKSNGTVPVPGLQAFNQQCLFLNDRTIALYIQTYDDVSTDISQTEKYDRVYNRMNMMITLTG